VNVDCRGGKASLVRGRVLAAGLALLAAGGAILGWGSHLRTTAASARQLRGLASSQLVLDGSHVTLTPKPDPSAARGLVEGLPLAFEPNQGQANLDEKDARARYVARGSGYSLFLGLDGATLSLVTPASDKAGSLLEVDSLEMKLAGANPLPTLSAMGRLPGYSNYLLGNEQKKWRTGVPHFSRIRYANLYPGIDLVFYGNQGQLEYDFQVAPGADPSRAELEFQGAKQLELNGGALVVKTERSSVRLQAPRIYQEIAGKQLPVDGRFVLRGANRAGFEVGNYDRSRELVIDPVLSFSTYFGGSGDELNTSVAVDGSFNVYLTGSTTSPNLPATGTFQTQLAGAGPNAYVAKIGVTGQGSQLLYVTYLGGNGKDTPVGIEVDGAGDAFLAGTTSSTNFPTTPTNAYQSVPFAGSTGTSHAFVTEVNAGPNPAAGTALLYSSYLSGNNTDIASGMAIDAAGNIFVTGTTFSNNPANPGIGIQFPASAPPAQGQAFQQVSNSAIQFFVTEVNTSASGFGSITYSTYFGGANFNPPSGQTLPTVIGGGIAVDRNDNIYFSGTTNFTYTGCSGCSSTDFPILNAYQPCLDQAPPTNPVNPESCTYSTTSPPVTPILPDAFVAKLSPLKAPGAQLQWSTYVGGSGSDSSSQVAVDSGAANVYLVGTTNSPDIASSVTTLTTSAPFQRCLDAPTVPTGTACPTFSGTTPPNDAFVARLTNPTNTSGTPVFVALNYFSFLGGSADDAGLAITVDSNSGAVVTGWTQSPDFPVAPPSNPIQSALDGPQDAFVARLNTAAVVGQATTGSWTTYFGGSGTDSGTGVALDVNQNTYIAGTTNSTDLQVAKPLPSHGSYNGGFDAFVTQLQTAVNLSVSGVLSLGTNQTFISAGSQAQFTYTITNNGPDLATNVTLTDNLSSQYTFVPLTFVSASTTAGTCGGVSTNAVISCTIPSLQSGSTATVTVVVIPNPNQNGTSPESFNGGSVQVLGPGNNILAQTLVPATMSDFSMAVSPLNQSVPVAGDSAAYQVQLTPRPLFNASISLSCSNLPTATACAFTPQSSVTLQNTSGATATLTITTTARPIPTVSLFTRHFYALWFVFPGLTLVLAGFGGSRRRRVAGLLMLCQIFLLLLFLPACSHTQAQAPVSGTPAGSYTVIVTATSGTGNSKSQNIGLAVP